MLTGMISVTMEAYVNDMLIKFVKVFSHTKDLRKTFERMRLHRVRMNPSKCAFGVQFGKFMVDW